MSNIYRHTNGKLYYSEFVFSAGQRVKRITKHSNYYAAIKQGNEVTVVSVNWDTGPKVGTMYNSDTGQYETIFQQKLYIGGSWYTASNFAPVGEAPKMTTIHAIEQDRPTFVREFKEVVVDGKTAREYIGDWKEFKNMSGAKTYTSTEITTAIRAKNDYRKFAIFQEKHVSQAKQPEIEFV